MTTELTKAAQQAHTPEHIAGVDHAHELLRRQGYHRDGDYFINVNRRGAEAIHVLTISLIVHAGQLCALTQRPAAQTEREAWVPYLVDRADGVKGHYAIGRWNPRGYREVWNLHSHRWAAYSDDVMSLEEADSLLRQITIPTVRASLPAPQQATPASAPQSLLMRLAGIAAECSDPDTTDALDALIAATQQATPERHLTVTTNQQDEAVMVSWQDDEHRILEVVWERKQATPEPVTLGPLAKRNIYDAIRGAYDLGYNDARNARTVPGDSAPGYDGRSVEEDHGGALFNTLNRRLAATPEPVGEVAQLVPEILSLADEYAEAEAKAGGLTGCGGDVGQQHELDEDAAYIKGRLTDAVGKLAAIATHPAPAVPEGLPAMLTDWGFDVHDDEDGRTWLTIRNPDDDVARMSVPTVWPLNGNQTIGAVVLHQFSAALTSALAAAQAKGGGQ